MQNLVGRIIDNKYEIKGQLGKGGMGSVYYVEDLKLVTIRAMKIIEKNSKDSFIDPMTEVDIMKIIQHSYLPTVIDFSEDENYVYIVMEVIQGSNLDKLLDNGNTKVEEDIVVNWAKQICSVLEYLHNGCSKKIIYKDLKPSNLIVSQDKERITLIDFGISQICNEDDIYPNIPIGTKGYAPKEQFKKDPIDETVDIYALGATIFHLLTGIRPRTLKDGFIPLREVDPNLSEGIEYIVAKCVQEDKSLRYSNVSEVIHDLENIHKIGQQYENKKKQKKQKVASLVGGAILSAMVATIGWGNVNKFIYEKYSQLIDKAKIERDSYNADGAIKLFKEAQSYMPKDNDSYYEIAKTYIANNRIDESIMYLNKLMEKKSSRERDDYFNYLLGKSYFIKGQGYYEKAFDYFEEVDEDNVDGDYPHLKTITQELIKYDSNEDINIEELKKSLKKSLEGFEVYIGSNSSDKLITTNLYMTLGTIYQTMPNELVPNSVGEQVRVLEIAYNLDSSNINLLKSLAVAYREKARDIRNTNVELRDSYLNKAIDKYTLCLESSGSKTAAIEIYRDMGDLYFSVANYAQAEANYKKIIEYNTDHYLGYMKMAASKNMQGHTDEARSYLKQAEGCKTKPKNDVQYIELKKDLG